MTLKFNLNITFIVVRLRNIKCYGFILLLFFCFLTCPQSHHSCAEKKQAALNGLRLNGKILSPLDGSKAYLHVGSFASRDIWGLAGKHSVWQIPEEK